MVSHPDCIHELRESEVLMAKDGPTVPNGEVNVVPGREGMQLSLHYNRYNDDIWGNLAEISMNNSRVVRKTSSVYGQNTHAIMLGQNV